MSAIRKLAMTAAALIIAAFGFTSVAASAGMVSADCTWDKPCTPPVSQY